MKTYSLSHLGDRDLLRSSDAVLTRNSDGTADLLAHLAEIEARKLYLEEGFSSMHEYCVQHMHLCEDAAHRRIRAARVARQFPAIFEAVASGRLHLTAVRLLARHLTAGNADELLAAAAHKSKGEIQQLLAERFPSSEMLTLVQALPGSRPMSNGACVPGPSGRPAEAVNDRTGSRSLAPEPEAVTPRPQVTPLATERFALQTTIDRSTYEDLEYARALLGHHLPASEIPAVLARALRGLVGELEKDRFAATRRPRSGRPHSSANPRHVPAEVKRTVWMRDGGQCSFVSESGRRCPARSGLELDHIEPVACGGAATVENLRLVCRGHNQLEAERRFGAGFMSAKREAARKAAEARRQETAPRAEGVADGRRQETAARAAAEQASRQESVARAAESPEVRPQAEQAKEPAQGSAEFGWQEAARAAEAAQRAAEARRQEFVAQAERAAQARRPELAAMADEARVKAAVEEIVTPLRILGCRADEARRIAATCAAMADAPLEERLRFAIRQLAPRHRTVAAAG